MHKLIWWFVDGVGRWLCRCGIHDQSDMDFGEILSLDHLECERCGYVTRRPSYDYQTDWEAWDRAAETNVIRHPATWWQRLWWKNER